MDDRESMRNVFVQPTSIQNSVLILSEGMYIMDERDHPVRKSSLFSQYPSKIVH
jgi:hypothetical protein